MKAQPILVRLVKICGNKYDIKFPELELNMTVNKDFFAKISNSPEQYKFLVYPYN
ncbi:MULTISPECIES: hypothetical protein [Tenacibaculum]|uniref:hypothetical protein n=1 Tax=Tenacibaculum TaxID=104267 RepID=UPI0015881C2D|nr:MULTISPECIES: hypothetical protein [Tenacibaculum]MCF2875727.1 hypothetical protein [Tenacibaculum sp. Cn5-1]MCF2935803.1 hypothetical protein [Tenacibaculum sp. Cn5-34]MCG7512363.1 hypothetical protein [Tenacibaculum sp. Cn5-46]